MAPPERTCVGCGNVRLQHELIRFHLGDGGVLLHGRTGRGRGAWLCRDTVLSCFDVAVGRNGFGRSLRHNIRAERLAELRHHLEQLDQ